MSKRRRKRRRSRRRGPRTHPFVAYVRGKYIYDPDEMTSAERFQHLANLLAKAALRLLYADWKKDREKASGLMTT